MEQGKHWEWQHGFRHLTGHNIKDIGSVKSIEAEFGVVHLTNCGSGTSTPDPPERLARVVAEYGERYKGDIFVCDTMFNADGITKWTTPGHGVYTTRLTFEEVRGMSLNTAEKGDRLVVTNEKSPWHGKTVVVKDVLVGQDYKKQSRSGDTYRVYKCTDKDMNVCMLSPTEVRRAEDSKKDNYAFKTTEPTPLGKMRLSTRQFRKEAGSDDQASEEWGLLVAIFNRKGEFLGLKVGCSYIEKDAIQEILDRLGEIGHPFSSADSMETAR